MAIRKLRFIDIRFRGYGLSPFFIIGRATFYFIKTKFWIGYLPCEYRNLYYLGWGILDIKKKTSDKRFAHISEVDSWPKGWAFSWN